MSLPTIIMLFLAGIGGGALSSLVGGAAVITYPALITAGIPPLQATACNFVSNFPGNFLAALSDRKQLPPLDRRFAGMVLASMTGAALGALLLLSTPPRVFMLLVPVLLGFATVLFAFAKPVSDWLRMRAQSKGRDIDFSVTNLKMLLPVSFYGGYFGAGVGVLLLAVLTMATNGDYRSANVTKNLVTSLNTAVASAILVVNGAVIWPQTLTLMIGSIIGSLLGATLARVAPRDIMRVAITVVGALLTGYFAYAYWF